MVPATDKEGNTMKMIVKQSPSDLVEEPQVEVWLEPTATGGARIYARYTDGEKASLLALAPRGVSGKFAITRAGLASHQAKQFFHTNQDGYVATVTEMDS
jgi:hypothetical protein